MLSARSRISPISPGRASPPAAVTTRTSTPGVPWHPIEPGFIACSNGWSTVPAGPVSVMPYT